MSLSEQELHTALRLASLDGVPTAAGLLDVTDTHVAVTIRRRP